MSKIDLTLIAGYADMSAEQKIAALEAYEIPDDDATKLKAAMSKAAGQAAEWKRKYFDTLDEHKKAEEEAAEQRQKDAEELATLRRENTIRKYEAQYLSAGYSADLASSSATAMADGDTATVIANQTAFLASEKQRMEAEALGKQPKPTPGNPPAASGDDDFFTNFKKYAGL